MLCQDQAEDQEEAALAVDRAEAASEDTEAALAADITAVLEVDITIITTDPTDPFLEVGITDLAIMAEADASAASWECL